MLTAILAGMSNRRKASLRKLGLVLICVIVCSGNFSCSTLPGAPRPEVRGVEAQASCIDFDGVNIVLSVDVYSPFLFPLHSPEFRYVLRIEGIDFITATVPAFGHLPARNTNTLVLPVHLSYDALLRRYPDLYDAREVPYQIRAAIVFSGIGGSLEIPFSHEHAFPILLAPTLTAAKVQLTDVSLQSATLLVDAEVDNPNVFELVLDGLDYELELEDIRVPLHNAHADGQKVQARQSTRIVLTGDIAASEGLITLLMNGISGNPTLSVSGSVWTPYGTASIAR